jgi:hypothetical protein
MIANASQWMQGILIGGTYGCSHMYQMYVYIEQELNYCLGTSLGWV